MELDFFVAVSALFPLLVLTKVGDRHRRQSANTGDHEPWMHRLFIVVALVGEGFALAGAAKKGVGEPEETIVIVALVICGLIFCIELLRSG